MHNGCAGDDCRHYQLWPIRISWLQAKSGRYETSLYAGTRRAVSVRNLKHGQWIDRRQNISMEDRHKTLSRNLRMIFCELYFLIIHKPTIIIRVSATSVYKKIWLMWSGIMSICFFLNVYKQISFFLNIIVVYY